jgi:hypothetical protein
VRVQRLSIHRDDRDEIPHRLTADGGHDIRVDWFTTIPRHTISVTAAGKEPIMLLVVPAGTAEGAAQTAMNMAATGPMHPPRPSLKRPYMGHAPTGNVPAGPGHTARKHSN